jgi:hypothetical protein
LQIGGKLGAARLVIDYLPVGGEKNQSRKIAFEEFKCDHGDFLPIVEKYYGRHMVAKAYLAEKSKSAVQG